MKLQYLATIGIVLATFCNGCASQNTQSKVPIEIEDFLQLFPLTDSANAYCRSLERFNAKYDRKLFCNFGQPLFGDLDKNQRDWLLQIEEFLNNRGEQTFESLVVELERLNPNSRQLVMLEIMLVKLSKPLRIIYTSPEKAVSPLASKTRSIDLLRFQLFLLARKELTH